MPNCSITVCPFCSSSVQAEVREGLEVYKNQIQMCCGEAMLLECQPIDIEIGSIMLNTCRVVGECEKCGKRWIEYDIEITCPYCRGTFRDVGPLRVRGRPDCIVRKGVLT